MVCAIGVNVFCEISRNFCRALYTFLKKTLVGGRSWLDLHVCNQTQFAILIIGFSTIHTVSLYALVAFDAVSGIRIIGILYAVCANLFLITKCHLPMANLVLLVENTF